MYQDVKRWLNVIFIVIDSLRTDSLEEASIPNLDALLPGPKGEFQGKAIG